MIFVTVGSQKFQFNRLLKEIDRLVKNNIIKEDVFAQIGYSDYRPSYYKYKQFLDRKEFFELEKSADIVITHGGTGAIIGALKNEKKVIAVPRLLKYGEHVDNHQLQVLSQFEEMNLIIVCKDIDDLGDAYLSIRKKNFLKYESNTDKILNNIRKFIELKR
ncbi:PssE/Cps14G family polysaccharide biosynthesis glycosyltransferase [Longibaculum muris]|uniref:PssE/Cps14G family polysaccharide biosynthesis glycosyltransferase n=1 Tax=Longibaculum muris TaxID=1796628 RepID=UPI0012B91EE1|nr:PssE/Cps14G family polysaccharide biosynthesis glycosyltransferase [Longibaculum muris]